MDINNEKTNDTKYLEKNYKFDFIGGVILNSNMVFRYRRQQMNQVLRVQKILLH